MGNTHPIIHIDQKGGKLERIIKRNKIKSVDNGDDKNPGAKSQGGRGN